MIQIAGGILLAFLIFAILSAPRISISKTTRKVTFSRKEKIVLFSILVPYIILILYLVLSI